ncbi:MAG: MGMT family protein [Mesonia hippocampi]|uniref:MGMT family protein n=1 Tax=Mesonia hippocampi TaxID=1628250 RepID=UPI003F990E13
MKNDNTDFYESVYNIVKQIPYGRVTSYGIIAKTLGAAKSARLVGYAMNNAAKYKDIPAHRVVNRNGELTGRHHFSGDLSMAELLENEGVEIKNDKVVNFKSIVWNPLQEF